MKVGVKMKQSEKQAIVKTIDEIQDHIYETIVNNYCVLSGDNSAYIDLQLFYLKQ